MEELSLYILNEKVKNKLSTNGGVITGDLNIVSTDSNEIKKIELLSSTNNKIELLKTTNYNNGAIKSTDSAIFIDLDNITVNSDLVLGNIKTKFPYINTNEELLLNKSLQNQLVYLTKKVHQPNDYAICDTAGNINIKVATYSGNFTPTKDSFISVIFKNAGIPTQDGDDNMLFPALTVNNTGVKLLYKNDRQIPPEYIQTDTIYDFLCDGNKYILINETKMPSDTKVTNTLNTTTKAYITGTIRNTENTGTQIFDNEVYLGSMAGSLYAKNFYGTFYGNASTSNSTSKLKTPRTISISGGALLNNKENPSIEFDGSSDVSFSIDKISASALNGQINKENLPDGVISKTRFVESQDDMLNYSVNHSDDIPINGDTFVMVLSTGNEMYIVKDDTNLNNIDSYVLYNPTNVNWDNILNVPQTIDSTGINVKGTITANDSITGKDIITINDNKITTTYKSESIKFGTSDSTIENLGNLNVKIINASGITTDLLKSNLLESGDVDADCLNIKGNININDEVTLNYGNISNISDSGNFSNISDSGLIINNAMQVLGNIYGNNFYGNNFYGNSTSTTQLKNLVTINGINFNGTQNITNFAICNTDSEVTTKEVNCPNFKLINGARISIYFQNESITETITLKINDESPKDIYFNDGNINGKIIQQYGIYDFIYDGERFIIANNFNFINEYSGRIYLTGTSSTTNSLPNNNITYYDKNIYMQNGKLTVSDVFSVNLLTKSMNLYYDGNTTTPNGGYIDFHFINENQKTPSEEDQNTDIDYTTRIIENNKGELNVVNQYKGNKLLEGYGIRTKLKVEDNEVYHKGNITAMKELPSDLSNYEANDIILII